MSRAVEVSTSGQQQADKLRLGGGDSEQQLGRHPGRHLHWGWETQCQTDQVVVNLLLNSLPIGASALASSVGQVEETKAGRGMAEIQGKSPCASPTCVCSGPLRMCGRTRVPPAHTR